MTHTIAKSPDYAAWLCEMKSRIRSAHISAARAVNRDMILLYWDIGRGILEKQKEQGWGKSVVDRLAADLKKEFPHIGVSRHATSGTCVGWSRRILTLESLHKRCRK